MRFTYRTLPMPAFEEYTARIAAGAVTFGVEYRHLDEAVILAYYGADARAKFDNKAPAGIDGPVEEDGLGLHVFGTRDGAEVLCTGLPELLERAGARDLARAVEPTLVAAALERVALECARMQAAGAPVRVAPRPARATASPS